MNVSMVWQIIYNHLPKVRAKFPDACNRIIREQVMQTIADVQENIVKYDAIDTGAMLNMVYGGMTGQYEGEVVSPAHYSGYVNYGTIRMGARPFFTDARDKAAKELPKRFMKLESYLS